MKLLNTKIESDIITLKKIASWLEDKDAEWSESLSSIAKRYEIVSGAYFTKATTEKNSDIEEWKRQNL